MDLALYMPGFLHVEHIKYKTCVLFHEKCIRLCKDL